MHLPAKSPFFKKAYHEAFDLMLETRDYVQYARNTGDMGTTTGDMLEFTQRSSRLTAQLTDVMTWLMAQRAAGEGHLTLDQALSADYALTCADDSKVEAVGEMSVPLKQLVGRGHSLYSRVNRLDKDVRAKIG